MRDRKNYSTNTFCRKFHVIDQSITKDLKRPQEVNEDHRT